MRAARGPAAHAVTNWRGPEAGTGIVVELIILAPLFMMLISLVVFTGRMTQARSAVDGAARDGARAASLARSVRGAAAAASQAVDSDLSGPQRVRCATWSTTTSGFAPGGQVTVTVRCTVPLRDLALLRLPGSMTLTASYPAVVDRYRGVAGP
jgi:Flp pilus assembly protein TadG